MSKLDKAVANSGNFAFEMKYESGFPIEFFGKTNPFSDKRKTLLSEILHPDDYMPFCTVVNEIINGKRLEIKTHARLKNCGEYRWYYISASAGHPSKGATDFCGMMFDVTEYLECEGEDAVMHNFRTKIKNTVISGDEPDILEILGEDYLELIQQPFSHIKGLYSAIVANDGHVIAAAHLQDKKINLNKMSYQRKKSIRVKHKTCATWIIAGESLEDINESAPLLDIMVQTVSEIANSYVVIGEEMENSQNANKMLGENFEDQILINNIYSQTIKSTDTNSAFSGIIPMVKEYFGLEKILFCMDEVNPVRLYYWDETGSLIPTVGADVRNDELAEQLENTSVLCVREKDYAEGRKDRSLALTRVYDNGVAKGELVFVWGDPEKNWTNRERKMIRSMSSILGSLIFRSFMENELAVTDEHLKRLAYTDTTTRMPNRAALERDLKALLADGETGAVISAEITNYKSMSEGYSFEYADDIVKSIAEYITAIPTHCRKKVYRFYPDILMIVLEDARKGEAIGFSKTVLTKFRSPWYLNDTEHKIEMYAGISFFPDDAYSVSDCVKAATSSLRLAKDRKMRDAVSYSIDLEEKLDENLRIRKMIVDSAENDFSGFYFLYTPVVDVKSGEVVSCEGNMLWTNNQIIVPSNKYLPIIIRLGLASKLCEFGMTKYCEFCAAVRENGLPEFRVGFEIYESTLTDDNGAVLLKKGLMNYELPPDAISLIVSKSEGTLSVSNLSMKQLSDDGINFVVDDKDDIFFTEDFWDTPCVSIQRINIKRLLGDDVSKSFMRAMIKRAHDKGLLVCAKGVDSPKLLEVARSFDVDLIQGIVNGRPLHTREFISKLFVPRNAV